MAWTYHPDRDQCYLHQFTPQQPDLNYRNPLVYQAMLNILRHWLTEGADGFRIDAINHMFEDEDLTDEEYVDPNGDLTVYDNLVHTYTMNRVSKSSQVFETALLINFSIGRII